MNAINEQIVFFLQNPLITNSTVGKICFRIGQPIRGQENQNRIEIKTKTLQTNETWPGKIE